MELLLLLSSCSCSGVSSVERSTIHFASRFGSRGRLPLPTVMTLAASFLAWLKKASDWHVAWLVFSLPRGFLYRKEIHLAVQKGGDLPGSSFVARLHDATEADAKASLWKLKVTHYRWAKHCCGRVHYANPVH